MTSRAKRDLADCLHFIRRHPRGKPADRERDIRWEAACIADGPEHRRIEIRRKSGVHLRRRSAAQFVIVYAYFKPTKRFPNGLVSIRAIRHRRVRNVFLGVRDTSGEHPPQYG
jgi:hypothetical protein